jgi:hypothetical protein
VEALFERNDRFNIGVVTRTQQLDVCVEKAVLVHQLGNFGRHSFHGRPDQPRTRVTACFEPFGERGKRSRLTHFDGSEEGLQVLWHGHTHAPGAQGLHGIKRGLVALGLFLGAMGQGRCDFIYWADYGVLSGGTGSINRANLDGTGRTSLVSLFGPTGIALDLGGGRIYWSEPNGQDIGSANLDGTGRRILVTGVSPWHIALDVAGGKMYWTETRTIMRANLDGTGRATVIAGLSYAQGIALDLAASRRARHLSMDLSSCAWAAIIGG